LSVTPFRLSGNELVALLVNTVPDKVLWSSLRVMGLLSDLEDHEKISDSYPPSEETVLRGTQALIDRGLMKFEDGESLVDPALEAVGLAFAQPESILSYQSVSPDVEFTSVIVDTSSEYRIVIDFAAGSSYEVSIIKGADTELLEFFTGVVKVIHDSFGTHLFDISYFTSTDDVLTAYIACTPNASEEDLNALELPRGGYWVISADVPAEGDAIKVYKINDEIEEIPVFKREFSSLDEALSNLQLRLLTEVSESASELGLDDLVVI